MGPKHVLLAVMLGLLGALPARASVVYTVFNPVNPPFPFVLFTYDSPGFIMTDTTVTAAQLAFINPLNDITSVQFILHSTDPAHLGDEELDVFETNPPPEETRYYPAGTFESFGVTAGLSGSFGFPNSMLRVAAPEPFSLGLLGVGAIGLLACRYRRSHKESQPI
jgi:hypothetical protein